jgi:hypothetical protein
MLTDGDFYSLDDESWDDWDPSSDLAMKAFA